MKYYIICNALKVYINIFLGHCCWVISKIKMVSIPNLG
jgi:hypothetical protein